MSPYLLAETWPEVAGGTLLGIALLIFYMHEPLFDFLGNWLKQRDRARAVGDGVHYCPKCGTVTEPRRRGGGR